jgi:hypothetical protein
MKHAVAIGSGDMIYMPSFIKIDSGIQKLVWGIHTGTQIYQHRASKVISKGYLYFLKIRKAG